ncbi:hypothetical protein MMC14_008441 [Varicellaria rhodocarpa]|nr:hypothetical protein [Varicellaria rhodocarpa]
MAATQLHSPGLSGLSYESGNTSTPEIVILPLEETAQRIRRLFLNSIAYVCDYKKGGTTTTAAALCDAPSGLALKLACNNKYPKKKFEDL